jgi:hypothetical protein
MHGSTVIDHMDELHARTGAEAFYFVDECLPPSVARQLSRGLRTADRRYLWMSEARFEKAFDRELLGEMAAAGCRYLLFGLESAAPRVMTLIDKGIDLGTIERVLQDTHEAGIRTHVFVFFGFPTETEAEARQTIDFLRTHRDHIDSYSAGIFGLEKGTPIWRDPEKYADRLNDRDDIGFGDDVEFEVLEGLDRTGAMRLLLELRSVPELRAAPVTWSRVLGLHFPDSARDSRWSIFLHPEPATVDFFGELREYECGIDPHTVRFRTRFTLESIDEGLRADAGLAFPSGAPNEYLLNPFAIGPRPIPFTPGLQILMTELRDHDSLVDLCLNRALSGSFWFEALRSLARAGILRRKPAVEVAGRS